MKKRPEDMVLFGGRKLSFERTNIMGVLNITDDSFYSESRVRGVDESLRRALSAASSGADIIDIGAESTRPGSLGKKHEEETASLIPIISAIRRELPAMPISVDTRKWKVAESAIEAGADIINDVSGLELGDEADSMARLTADSKAAYVLTHTRGTPDVMQLSPGYDDVIGEVTGFLRSKISFLNDRGLPSSSIIIDPGIGFGKRYADNLAILANVGEFLEFGLPVLIGASRKGFIGSALGGTSCFGPERRLEGTIAVSAICAYAGVNIIRAHDVEANRNAVDMADAVGRHVV